MEKYFRWEITAEGLHWERNQTRIQRDADLDGVYVLRTSVAREHFDAEQTVLAYKRLAGVERTFRSFKSVDLEVRPIHHRLPNRVRTHISSPCWLITWNGTCVKPWPRYCSTMSSTGPRVPRRWRPPNAPAPRRPKLKANEPRMLCPYRVFRIG